MQNQQPMQSRQKLILVGIATWVIVAVAHIQRAFTSSPGWSIERVVWLLCLFGFIVAFLLATRQQCSTRGALVLVGVQATLALIAIALNPDGFLPILLVVVAGQLDDLPTRIAVLWIAVQSLLLLRYETVTVALAYFTFQLFSVFAARIATEEREAKQALAEANAEIRVATGLLAMSSRAEERLRIAREIHDLLGHHLTALSLNLEVASHLAEGAAKEHIEKSQALTKLLLSDVRDSVSRLREDEPVDLAAALRSITEVVPSPAIHIDVDGVAVTDPTVARTALRAVQEIVTNAVRHAGARNLWLTLRKSDGALAIDARDDGAGTDHVRFGNGLRGMRERVQEAGGSMDVSSMRGHGFEVHIRL